MKRVLVLITVVALMLVILAMSVAPAFAAGCERGAALFTAANASKGRCFMAGGV